MNYLIKDKYDIREIAMLAITIGFLILILFNGMSDSYLWYDESGQFWISKGLYHYSQPNSESGSLLDVLFYNRHYNMDPGGYSVLLYFWIKIVGGSAFALRSLSALFYIVFFVYLYRLFAKYTHSSLYMYLMIMSILARFAFISVEVRAYSMELCGVAMSMFYFLRYLENKKLRDLVFLNVILFVTVTSRYDAVILGGIQAAYLLLHVVGSKFDVSKLQKARYVIFSFSLLAIVAFIYFVEMRYQKSDASSYVPYLKNDWTMLYTSQVSRLFYLNIAILAYEYFKNKKVTHLSLFVVISGSVFFVLSSLALYPWDAYKCTALRLVGLLNLFIFVCNFVASFPFSLINNKVLPLFFCLLFGINNKASGIRSNVEYKNNTHSKVSMFFEKTNGITFIDYGASPSIRYLYEYGFLNPYTQRDNYPASFVFQVGKRHSDGETYEKGVKNYTISTTKCDFYMIFRPKNVLNHDSLKPIQEYGGLIYQQD